MSHLSGVLSGLGVTMFASLLVSVGCGGAPDGGGEPSVGSEETRASALSAATPVVAATSGTEPTLSTEQRAVVVSLGMAVAAGEPVDTVQSRWAELVADVCSQGCSDVNALVQQVLNEAYQQTSEDLRAYAEKVKFLNDVKRLLRTEIVRARQVLRDNEGKADEEPLVPAYSINDARITTPSIAVVSGAEPAQPRELKTKAELQTHLDALESKLGTVGDDAQLANVDLQNVLQRQQQTLQVMSNISKMLHDTAMAVIRKIGG